MADHIRLRSRPRNGMSQSIVFEADPPQIQTQSTRSKSTISSLFHSANNTNTSKKKLNNFTQSTFRGFGCTAAASQQVSLPAVIRTSADWDGKKVKKKKQKNVNKNSTTTSSNNAFTIGSYSNKGSSSGGGGDGDDGGGGGGGGGGSNVNSNIVNNSNGGNCMVIQDVWCGPGIGFSGADAVVGSVDCVVARRNVSSGRGKIDAEKFNQRERERERERSSCIPRRTVTPDSLPFPDSDPAFGFGRPELDVFGPRYYRHLRHPSPDGLAEIMMLQNSLLMGGRLDSHDHFRDWRLDVDNMSYEELLELGERIGYVNTGLKEDEMGRCLRKLKNSVANDLSSYLSIHVDKKCTICQEEYEEDDEMGKLDCGHSFHIQCIKQWLAQKNACPVCKITVVSRC
ncbi:E3 ubiquitin-protein ligase MBR1 [Pistacia vera]|uniref:E3 ubiquitin-protein ligase MBR1 n=1 Tax=Pistacia vera TaxID=55513 RepID=UPI0012632AEB|nr:E3 ubiquitin-protein ligase MBR1 [Pistacia vera]